MTNFAKILLVFNNNKILAPLKQVQGGKLIGEGHYGHFSLDKRIYGTFQNIKKIKNFLNFLNLHPIGPRKCKHLL